MKTSQITFTVLANTVLKAWSEDMELNVSLAQEAMCGKKEALAKDVMEYAQ